MSKASFIRENNGKLFKATVTGMNTIEDIPAMRIELQKIAKNNNTELIEKDNSFSLKDFNAFWDKPKIKREYTGTIKFKSTTYIVKRSDIDRDSFGDIPASDHFTEDSFYIDTGGNGRITYQLIK